MLRLIIIPLLFLFLGPSFSLKCPSLIADREVNMWFAYKFPAERKGNEQFLYRDSNSDANTDFRLVRQKVVDLITEKMVTNIYKNQNKDVNFKHVDDLWEEYKDADPDDRDEVATRIKTEAAKLKVYQFWTNDQPDFNSGSPYTPPEDIYMLKNSRPLDLRTKKPVGWSYAHSKLLVSIDTTDHSGFIMDHSYPAVPVDLHAYDKDGNFEVRIFPFGAQRDVMQLGQHAMCVSFPAAKYNDVITALTFMYPRVNTDNFPFYPYWQDMANILALIKGDTSRASGATCATTWRQKTKETMKRSLNSEQNPTPECTTSTSITVDGFTYRIISHAAVNKIKADLNSKSAIPNLNGLGIGPFPWKEVTATIKSTMFITARWMVSNRLNSINADNGYYLVEDFKYPGLDNWGTGCEHSKWAVTIPQVTFAGLKYFCAGDTNNENSQITHAGIAICFIDANLRDGMLALVNSIQNSRYWINPSNDAPTHSQAATTQGGYASNDPAKPKDAPAGGRKKRKMGDDDEASAPAKPIIERHPKKAKNKKEEDAASKKEKEEEAEVKKVAECSSTCAGCSNCDLGNLDEDEDE